MNPTFLTDSHLNNSNYLLNNSVTHLNNSVTHLKDERSESSGVIGDTLIETIEYGPKRIDSVKDCLIYCFDDFLDIKKITGSKLIRENAYCFKLTYIPDGPGKYSKIQKELIVSSNAEIILKDGNCSKVHNLKIGDRFKAFKRKKNAWGHNYSLIGLTDEPFSPEHHFIARKFLSDKITPGCYITFIDNNQNNLNPNNLQIIKNSIDYAKKLHDIKHTCTPWRNENLLKELYAKYNVKQIAAQLKTTSKTILKWLKIYKIIKDDELILNHTLINIIEIGRKDIFNVDCCNFICNSLIVK